MWVRRGFMNTVVFGVFALAMAMQLALACSYVGGKDDELTEKTRCREGCESNIWPRLIIGVVPPEGSNKDGSELVRAKVRLVDGSVLDGQVHGCPDAPGIVCTYSFFTSPKDRYVVLMIEPIDFGGSVVETRIPLGRFNYCGREIAYVVATVSSEGKVFIGKLCLISPCEGKKID